MRCIRPNVHITAGRISRKIAAVFHAGRHPRQVSRPTGIDSRDASGATRHAVGILVGNELKINSMLEKRLACGNHKVKAFR